MQCDTYLFGRIDVAPESVITFPQGIPGFSSRRFTLVHDAENEGAPDNFTLQSLDEPAVALLIADPAVFGLRYELDLSAEESALMQSTDASVVAAMLVLNKQEDNSTPVSANVQAPLLINTKTRVGLQRILKRTDPAVSNDALSALSTPA